jgi:hypothetical protein
MSSRLEVSMEEKMGNLRLIPGGAVRRGMRPAQATGAAAVGALAVGAMALGAFAIGALAIRRLVIWSGRVEKLSIGELTVDRLIMREPAAEDVVLKKFPQRFRLR